MTTEADDAFRLLKDCEGLGMTEFLQRFDEHRTRYRAAGMDADMKDFAEIASGLVMEVMRGRRTEEAHG